MTLALFFDDGVAKSRPVMIRGTLLLSWDAPAFWQEAFLGTDFSMLHAKPLNYRDA